MASIPELNQRVMNEVRKVIVGQDRVAQLSMVAILCGGHVLLEGTPGVGKTLLMRTLSKALGLKFGRVQFTPDLMPSDIVGTNIFNFQKNQFILQKGPIFTQFLLGDEINRTPPKTQSALLEAMQEGSVTLDGKSYPLSKIFVVAATQNPIEQEGTYPLPEAQLDRFLFKLDVEYPSHKAEVEMVRKHQRGLVTRSPEDMGVKAVTNEAELLAVRKKISSILVSDGIIDYVVTLVRKTRENPFIHFGASPRSALMLASASRALAVLEGREYVIPEDVKTLIEPALRHRIILTPTAQIEGVTIGRVLDEVISDTKVPR